MEALVAFSLDKLGKASVITSSASVPKELIATEKNLSSDTLLFCPETLFFLSGELRLNDQIFLENCSCYCGCSLCV